MNIVFRADASIDIGTGHVVRCLTLAQGLRENGANCTFICRAHQGNLIDLIARRGFQVLELALEENGSSDGDGTAHAAWLGVSWQQDARQCSEALRGSRPDWLVVDHYGLDARWENSMRAHCARLMVIDDLADRAHDCELLLDQNLGRQAFDYTGLVPDTCRVLVGPVYALLRSEFAALREFSLSRRASPTLGHLLISMGGVDKNNVTARLLAALRNGDLCAGLRITVVMGATAPWLEEVRTCASQMPCPTTVSVDVTDMADLMASADLAIGAAGTTAWERCTLGLPTLLVVLAENQRDGALALEAAGAVVMIDGGGKLEADLADKLGPCSTPAALRRMQEASGAITDGAGVSRIVVAMNDGKYC